MAMQLSILQLLRNHSGEYLSGEEISRRLGISRTAVWKHIQALKVEGYEIESHYRSGYYLKNAPDLLKPAEVQSRLETEKLGRQIYYYKSIESTNNEAKKLAAAGCPEGTVVIAEEQTSGRGRLSRGWFSPRGKGIWFSLVLRPVIKPQDAPKFTLMAAAAINRAIRKSTGVACGIKWPNDILFQGKKLVGVLTEMSAEMDAVNYVIIGMGINVNIPQQEFPAGMDRIATSIQAIRGATVSRLDLLASILEEMEKSYLAVLEQGFGPMLEDWRNQSITLGQIVDVIGIGAQFTGKAIDIDRDGALLVETGQGIERVLAGDVSIRAKFQGGM